VCEIGILTEEEEDDESALQSSIWAREKKQREIVPFLLQKMNDENGILPYLGI